MGYEFQVTVDAVDPHVLAAWWADALGWQVEPTDSAFVQSMVDKGFATQAETRIYEGALVWRIGAAIKDPEHPDRPRVLFQEVPEAKSVKNRIHLDVRVGGEKYREVAEALISKGATHLWDGAQGPYEWITLADPEGNEFCVG